MRKDNLPSQKEKLNGAEIMRLVEKEINNRDNFEYKYISVRELRSMIDYSDIFRGITDDNGNIRDAFFSSCVPEINSIFMGLPVRIIEIKEQHTHPSLEEKKYCIEEKQYCINDDYHVMILWSIMEFLNNNIPIGYFDELPFLSGLFWKDVPKNLQELFLSYKLNVWILKPR